MNLSTVEIKAFIPAKDFEHSKQFYQTIGFTMASSSEDVAYFHYDNCSFLLQNFYAPQFAENLVMHLLVENVDDWYQHLQQKKLDEHFGIKIQPPEDQPWAMRDFVLSDPSGVFWRIAQNIN